MSKGGMRSAWLCLSACLVAALVGAAPATALASPCDELTIAKYTVDEAAQSLWDHSDLIGFGIVSIINDVEREQWFVDMVVTLKGEPDQHAALTPVRVGRVGNGSSGMRGVPRRSGEAAVQGELVFVALSREEEGFVTPDCQTLVMDRNRTALIRRLAEMSREHGSNQASR
jgi:hypothetical protein